MPSLVEELSARAKTLSAGDRARRADELLESLEREAGSGAEPAWDRETGRRVAKVETATAALMTGEQVHAEARRLITR